MAALSVGTTEPASTIPREIIYPSLVPHQPGLPSAGPRVLASVGRPVGPCCPSALCIFFLHFGVHIGLFSFTFILWFSCYVLCWGKRILFAGVAFALAQLTYDFILAHYEFCQKNKLNTCESNIIKYACRHGRKNGEGGVKDVKKIIHYAELLLELDYANETQEEWTD